MLEKLRSKYRERCHFSKNQNFGVSWVLTISLSVSPSADFSKLTFFSTLQVNRALQCILLSLQNPRFFYGLFKSTGDFKALDRRRAQKSLKLFQIYKIFPNFSPIEIEKLTKILQSGCWLVPNKNNEKVCLCNAMCVDNIRKGKIFPHLIEVRLFTVRHSNHEDCSRPGKK